MCGGEVSWGAKCHGERSVMGALGWNARVALQLLQWVAFTLIDRDGGDRSGIDTQSLRKRLIFNAVSMQQSGQTIVSFDAARLGIDSVFLVALQGEFLFGGPRPHPHCRIFDGDGI